MPADRRARDLGPVARSAGAGVGDARARPLYVDRSLWGSGLAAELLECAVGDLPVHLWVYEANARARACYQKHGFVPDRRSEIDDVTGVMECRYVRARRAETRDPATGA